MRAEIVSVGTEILLGDTLDTNANRIARSLPSLGIDLFFMSQVGDNLDRVTDTIRRAWQRSDLVIVTGGLGPTEDDLTREAIAKALGEEMNIDHGLELNLRQFCTERGITFTERNLKQATLIPSAQALANSRGTAPGWWVEQEGKVIVAMPGVPPEMEQMWIEKVIPRLSNLTSGEVLILRVLKTMGLSEARVDELISPLSKSANPTIGVYAKRDGVHLRLAAKAINALTASHLIESMECSLRDILGKAIWGSDDDTLQATVGQLLEDHSLTLASMESCTGGLFASTITDVPGSSNYFQGGYIAYTSDLKRSLGVQPKIIKQHGVVSKEVAIDMARAARDQANTDIGIGITGVAGPDQLEGHRPGTVHIGLYDGESPQSKSYSYYQGRTATKARAVMIALSLLLQTLQPTTR